MISRRALAPSRGGRPRSETRKYGSSWSFGDGWMTWLYEGSYNNTSGNQVALIAVSSAHQLAGPG